MRLVAGASLNNSPVHPSGGAVAVGSAGGVAAMGASGASSFGASSPRNNAFAGASSASPSSYPGSPARGLPRTGLGGGLSSLLTRNRNDPPDAAKLGSRSRLFRDGGGGGSRPNTSGGSRGGFGVSPPHSYPRRGVGGGRDWPSGPSPPSEEGSPSSRGSFALKTGSRLKTGSFSGSPSPPIDRGGMSPISPKSLLSPAARRTGGGHAKSSKTSPLPGEDPEATPAHSSDAELYAERLRQLAILEAEMVERPPTSMPEQGASFCIEDSVAVDAVRQGLGCLTVSDPSQEHSPMVYVSPGFEKLTGYSREELLGRSIGCLHAREADEAGVKKLREVMEGVRGDVGDAVRVELLSKKKSGETFWLATHAVPVKDSAGKLLRVVAVSYDITARKAEARDAAEECSEEQGEGVTLSGAERRLNAARLNLPHMLSAVGITDPASPATAGPLSEVSEGFERLSGFSANEVCGLSPLCLCAADQGRAAVGRVSQAVRSAGFAAHLIRLHDKRGAPMWCMVYAAPLWDPHGGLGSSPDSDDEDVSAAPAEEVHVSLEDMRFSKGATEGGGGRECEGGERGEVNGDDGYDRPGVGDTGPQGGGLESQKQGNTPERSSGATVPAYVYVYIDVTLRRPSRIGQYQLGEMLGRGSFGEVRIARDRERGKEGGPGFGTGSSASGPECVAVKIIDTSKFRSVDDIAVIQDETQILEQLKHVNVIELKEVFLHNSLFVFVMELAHGGTLMSLIYEDGRPKVSDPLTVEEKNKSRSMLDEERVRELFRQVLAAVEFCHRRHVVHRDLKPENILLDDGGTIKVADFGLSTIVKPFEPGKGLSCGTPAFMAPELFTAGKMEDTGPAVDVWSMGVILYEMIMGKLPFVRERKDGRAGNGRGKAEAGKTLAEVIREGRVHYPPWMSEKLVDVLQGMLQVSVSQRLTVNEIKRHPWVTAEEEDDLMLDTSDSEAGESHIRRAGERADEEDADDDWGKGGEGEGGVWGVPVSGEGGDNAQNRDNTLPGKRATDSGSNHDEDTAVDASHMGNVHNHTAAHLQNLALLDAKSATYGPGNAAARGERKKRDFLSRLLSHVPRSSGGGNGEHSGSSSPREGIMGGSPRHNRRLMHQ